MDKVMLLQTFILGFSFGMLVMQIIDARTILKQSKDHYKFHGEK